MMKRRSLISLLSLAFLVAPALGAQSDAAVGLELAQISTDGSPMGPSTGGVCTPFSCNPEFFLGFGGFGSLRFTVYGESSQPYLVLGSFTTGGCKTFPGVANALVLGEPFFIVRGGIHAPIAHPCLLGSMGADSFDIPMPRNPMGGVQITVQVLTFEQTVAGAGGLALSNPITIMFAGT